MYKEIINNLMEANKDDSDVLDFIQDKTNSFIDYQAYVSFMEMRMTRLRIEDLEPQDYRDKVQSLDQRRRSLHEVAIGGVNALNRLCAANDIKPLMADTSDRHKIGDFCFEISSEYFKTNRGASKLEHHVTQDGHHVLDVPNLELTESDLSNIEGSGMQL